MTVDGTSSSVPNVSYFDFSIYVHVVYYVSTYIVYI
jgi:hypothetical protein